MVTYQVTVFMIESWLAWYWSDVTKTVITLSAHGGTSVFDEAYRTAG